MIREKISDDIKEEISSVKKLSVSLMDQFDDLDATKEYLGVFLSDEINSRSMILVDTLINYQMQDIRTEMNKLDSEVQIAFYDLNLREFIRESVKEGGSSKSLQVPDIEYSNDTRLKEALIISGAVFFTASGISYTSWLFDPTKIISLIIGGLATIGVTIYAYKKAYEHAEVKARNVIIDDLNIFLERVNELLLNWLLSIQEVFEKEFERFCNNHSILIDRKDNI